jgi:prephenate dehydrogenase
VSEDLSERRYFYQKAALIGTGLIGGSIGIALREKHLVKVIYGYDSDPESGAAAVEKGAIDFVADSTLDAVRDADLVILAVPVMSTLQLLKEIIPAVGSGAVITDVGSTKGSIMAAVEQMLPPNVHFIGGHPMAGSEESGITGADPALLENAIYVLTPGLSTPPEAIDRLTEMFEKAGAQPLMLDPLAHDRAVASISHLPHIVAAALVQSVVGAASEHELVHTLAAGGFRDSTRIALGNPDVWRDICISNRWALLAALKRFKVKLDTMEKALAEPKPDSIKEYLQQARDYRKTIPYRGRGILPDLHEVIVLVRDTPGVIGRLAGLLGEAGINIDAIEIMHVRELSGGSIRLGFRDKKQQQQAESLLREKGFSTHCPGS